MNLLAFDWKGIFAHFRQFDTNSSSLSYSLPPPTVVAGTVAGLLELERDSYYELLNENNMQMAVQILSRPRKIMQTVNYAYIKNRQDLYRSLDDEHTQIPMELVVSETFPEGELHYRIILSFRHKDVELMLEKILREKMSAHIPFMGSAPFFSWIEWPGEVKILEEIPPGTETIIRGVAALHLIKANSISLEPLDGQMPTFFREHVRREFLPDREPGPVIDLIWERNRDKIKAIFRKPTYRIQIGDQESTILFY
jgi:CRISPR-associated protein Cas5h